MTDTRNVAIQGDASHCTINTGDTIVNVSADLREFEREPPYILKSLIDRRIQIKKLKAFTVDFLKNDVKKPLICILPGPDDASHASLVERYQEIEFTSCLKMAGKPEQKPQLRFISWPRQHKDTGLEDAFKELCERFVEKEPGLNLDSTPHQIRNALDRGGRHYILRCDIPCASWCHNSNELIKKWVEYLSNIPASNHNVHLIVFLCFYYKPWSALIKTMDMKAMVNQLKLCKMENVLCLRPLPDLSVEDAEQWVGEVCNNYEEILHPEQRLDETTLRGLTIKSFRYFGLLSRRRSLSSIIEALDNAIEQSSRKKVAGASS